MTQELPPGISALAHQHRLGTPLKCYTQSGTILLISVLLVIFLLSEVLYLLTVLTHPDHFTLVQVVPPQVLDLVLIGYALYTLWDQRSSYFYLCSAGFLELKRDKALAVKHALRWDDVRDVRRSRGRYYVTDKQGQEFRINCRDIWKCCREQPKVKKARKRA